MLHFQTSENSNWRNSIWKDMYEYQEVAVICWKERWDYFRKKMLTIHFCHFDFSTLCQFTNYSICVVFPKKPIHLSVGLSGIPFSQLWWIIVPKSSSLWHNKSCLWKEYFSNTDDKLFHIKVLRSTVNCAHLKAMEK